MIQLLAHQAKGLALSEQRRRFCFFWKPGTGKTFLVCAIIKERPIKTLIVCPGSVIDDAWVRSGETMGLDPVVLWQVNERVRAKLASGSGTLFVTTYETFRRMVPVLLGCGFQRVVFDESSKCKNWKASTSKAAIRFSDRMIEVYNLSGTPAPNCDTELYAQLRCLGRAVAGDSFYAWAHRWFYPVRRSVRGKSVIAGWKAKPAHLTPVTFSDYLRRHSWSLSKEECLDLPAKTDIIRRVELSDDEEKAYALAVSQLAIEVESGRTADFASEGLTMKLRQLAGGMVLANGNAIEIGSSRLDELADTLEEIGNDPVVVWAEFTHNVDRIVKRFQGAKRTAFLDGRTSKNAGEIVAAFQRGDTDLLVCHPKASAHGITLTRSNVAIFYDLSFSAEEHEQARDRIHRVGQRNACTYFYLLGRDTIDEALFGVVTKKLTRQDALLRTLRRPLGSGHIQTRSVVDEG